MKHLFTQLGAALIVLFALNINAQSLVGLPQHSVTLSGSVPIAVDHTGRGLLGYVLHRRDANGNGPVELRLRSRFIRLNRPEPEDLPPGQKRMEVSVPGVGPIIKTTLDAVIFSDGEYVSAPASDVPYDAFAVMSLKVNAEKSLAQLVAAARTNRNLEQSVWQQVATAAAISPRNEGATVQEGMAKISQQSLARDLLHVREKEGDQAAYDVAERSAKLPTLWRKQ